MRTTSSLASLSLALLLSAGTQLTGQTKTPTEPAAPRASDDVLVLSPFTVDSSQDRGYQATNTLAGTRLKTDLRDVGSAIQVITDQFLKDTGVRNTEELLKYTTSTEVGGQGGNFSGSTDLSTGTYSNETPKLVRPNTNTRVRGLSQADLTRDFFLTDIPWDSYNTDRVDLQRGPNSILFGLGNPSGIVNAGLKSASFKTSHDVEFRFDKYGSYRGSFDFNEVLLKDQLALRIDGLYDKTFYQQEPAFRQDKRIYAALRYDPAFLNRGSAHTTFKANFENGDVKSNNPRSLPPIDRITPWFQTGTYTIAANPASGQPQVTYPALDHGVYNVYDAYNYLGNPATVGRVTGQTVKTINVGGTNVINPAFQPGISEVYTAGVILYYDPTKPASSPSIIGTSNGTTLFGIGNSGAIDKNVGGIPYGRIMGVSEIVKMKSYQGVQYFAQYRDPSLTDSSVFDFYHQLFDGPNKNEFRKFNSFNLDLSQTFLNNRVGFDLAYDRQSYSDGQNALFNDRTQMINVDVNATLTDGSPNPNAGRPVMYGTLSGGGMNTERTEARATAFAEVRAEDFLARSWLTKLLGRHVFTGLYSQNRYDRENLSWARFALDTGFSQITGQGSAFSPRAVEIAYYLGGDMRGIANASGLNLPNIKESIEPTGTVARYFDSHWKQPTNPATAGYVNPAAPWTNPFTGTVQSQAENPANYVGWTTYQATVLNSNTGDLNQLLTSATKNRFDLKSKALVWQGFFLDGLLVPTFGYRTDTNKTYTVNAPTGPSANALTGSPTYIYPSAPRSVLETTIRSWSLVAHSPDFINKHLPLDSTISLTYNKSNNFNPSDVGRVDMLGQSLAPSSGMTKDYGVVLTMLDNRVAFKVTKFETSVLNASYSWTGAFWVGSQESRGWVAAKRYQAGLTGAAAYSGANYNFGSNTGAGGTFVQSAADLAQQQAAVSAALAAFPSQLFTAWQIPTTDAKWNDPAQWDANAPWGQSPAGYTATRDTASKGYEYELSMNLTKQWTLIMNAAHTTATTTNNVGNMAAWIEERNAIWQGPAGDLRIFGGTSTDTMRNQWNNTVWGPYVYQKYLNGLNVPELRPWRFNVITNYNFANTLLKGVSVGAGYTWQDKQAIGYPWTRKPINGVDTDVPDVTKPIYGPTDSTVDLWTGYERQLTKRVKWRVQLNVRNAFGQNKLIPISVNPDGSICTYRIKEGMSWTITNRFSF